MKFYNRKNEIDKFRQIERASRVSSRMTVLVGRRRIGKTKLIKEVFGKAIYLFVSRKSEALLCEEFVSIVEAGLNIKIHGTFSKFAPLFEYLMDIATHRNFTLVIDEFQEFSHINGSIYSELQNIWDQYKEQSKMNLILCGSIYFLMKKIFEDKKEPLFGRADTKFHLKPFTVATLKEIIKEEYPVYINDDLLSLYMFTGGVAKYVELFVNAKAFTLTKQLNFIFDEFSLFLEEGKNLLIEEFGKEYTIYFSILSLIASSKTSRTEIESIMERNIGGYLDRLENEYSIISKIRPIFAKEKSRTVKYGISDNYLNFWFRFIYKYRSAIEIENYEYIKKLVRRDYTTYSGRFLEKYFREKLKLSLKYSMIGSYWERGNQNEIDIVAVNKMEKKILFAEVRRNSKKIDLDVVKEKADKLVKKFSKYSIEYVGYSLSEM